MALISLTKQMIQRMALSSYWMLPRIAFDWIESTIPKGDAVLEFGSGEGSISLAQHYELISVEHDEGWVGHAKIPRITLPPSLTTVFQSNTATLVGMNRRFLMPSFVCVPHSHRWAAGENRPNRNAGTSRPPSRVAVHAC